MINEQEAKDKLIKALNKENFLQNAIDVAEAINILIDIKINKLCLKNIKTRS